MTNSFLKLELKYKLKLFITLGLQEVLQSPLRRKKALWKVSSKSVLHRMNRITKLIRIFSKQLKNSKENTMLQQIT